ncbi:MAG: hypothetical protein RLP02_17005, partial [Coleofasciculus sp. C2-GNP5-27]
YKNPVYPGLKGFYSSSLVCHCAILGKQGEQCRDVACYVWEARGATASENWSTIDTAPCFDYAC